ncbi:MAG: hypothetical protein E7368_03520 [Clostridiales bacterium]|nr:hypothetical protein [Clostridiales bacterium]
MVVAGVLLLQRMQSVEQGVNLAGWAVVISYLFSFSTSLICLLVRGGKFARSKKQLKPLFSATLPITAVRASGSLVSSAVAVLLPIMLIRAGANEGEALTLFGVVSGMAMPVLFIPSTIIGSLSLVLVPELAEDYYRKNHQRLYKNLARGLTTAFLVSCFLLPFFYAVGRELGMLAFSNPLAGEFIQKGCPILLPMSLTMISTGMLNSMGYEKQTFIFYFVGAGALLLCILLLPALCGAYAYLIGMGVSFLVTAVCNLIFLSKKCKGLFSQMRLPNQQNGFRTHAKALLCVLPLSLIGALIHALFSNVFGAFLAVAVASLVLAFISTLLWTLLGILPFKKILAIRKKREKSSVF